MATRLAVHMDDSALTERLLYRPRADPHLRWRKRCVTRQLQFLRVHHPARPGRQRPPVPCALARASRARCLARVPRCVALEHPSFAGAARQAAPDAALYRQRAASPPATDQKGACGAVRALRAELWPSRAVASRPRRVAAACNTLQPAAVA